MKVCELFLDGIQSYKILLNAMACVHSAVFVCVDELTKLSRYRYRVDTGLSRGVVSGEVWR